MNLFTEKTWKERISEYPNRRVLTKTDQSTEIVIVERSEGSITEEAVTGPAKQPLPASSQPHSKFSVKKKGFSINFFLAKILFYSLLFFVYEVFR